MEYFAGLDVSMDETHICVVDRDGGLVLETKAKTSPEAIAAGLAKAPECKRIVFETGRMAPTLYHGLDALRLPVICIESRQAYQALKSLWTHKTDRNDARGLAHLGRTGFFKRCRQLQWPEVLTNHAPRRRCFFQFRDNVQTRPRNRSSKITRRQCFPHRHAQHGLGQHSLPMRDRGAPLLDRPDRNDRCRRHDRRPRPR